MPSTEVPSSTIIIYRRFSYMFDHSEQQYYDLRFFESCIIYISVVAVRRSTTENILNTQTCY